MHKEVKKYFEEIADDFDSYYDVPNGIIEKIINEIFRKPGLLKRLKIALDLANPTSSKRILDVGCGSGKFIVECAKRGAFVQGIDISQEMINLAKRFCRDNNVQAELEIGDASQHLPKNFDVCVALGVFEYFEDPKPILDQMLLSLNDEGKIIFSVPKKYTPQTPLRDIMLRLRNVKCYYYTKKRIIDLLKRSSVSYFEIFSYGPGYVISGEKGHINENS